MLLLTKWVMKISSKRKIVCFLEKTGFLGSEVDSGKAVQCVIDPPPFHSHTKTPPTPQREKSQVGKKQLCEYCREKIKASRQDCSDGKNPTFEQEFLTMMWWNSPESVPADWSGGGRRHWDSSPVYIPVSSTRTQVVVLLIYCTTSGLKWSSLFDSFIKTR